MVGVESAQTVLDRSYEPPPGPAPMVRVGAHRDERLRREDDLVASVGQRPSDHLLALAHAVGVGRVDEVDARIERPVDHRHALVVVGVAHRAEHHGAEAVLRNDHPGLTERPGLHRGSPLRASGNVDDHYSQDTDGSSCGGGQTPATTWGLTPATTQRERLAMYFAMASAMSRSSGSASNIGSNFSRAASRFSG